MRSPTLMLLMVEWDYRTVLTAEEVGEYYFGYTRAHARRLAAQGTFPIATFRMSDSQKAPWGVLLSDLAEYLDRRAAQARVEMS